MTVHSDDAPSPIEADAPETVETEVSETSNQAYEELNNQYLRLAADFDNFRKRGAQEREALLRYGAHSTLERILPVVDNLERAFQSLSETSDSKVLFQSFTMLHQQLLEAIKHAGVTPIDDVGQPFDPERHEAVSQQESAEYPDNAVLQVYQKGYLLHDKVIRPAQVVVSVKSEDHASPSKEATEAKSTFESPASDSNPFQGA